MGQKYTVEKLHPIRHMDKYVDEIMAGSVSPYRTQELKKRFADVKALAQEMYQDANKLIVTLDEEMEQDVYFLWKHDLENMKIFSMTENHSFGDYSNENLHPIRHFEEYVLEIRKGGLSDKRVHKLKERLRTVLVLSVRLYFDAERLIRLLD